MLREVNTLKCHDLSLTRKNVTKEKGIEIKERDGGLQLVKMYLFQNLIAMDFLMEMQLPPE